MCKRGHFDLVDAVQPRKKDLTPVLNLGQIVLDDRVNVRVNGLVAHIHSCLHFWNFVLKTTNLYIFDKMWLEIKMIFRALQIYANMLR